MKSKHYIIIAALASVIISASLPAADTLYDSRFKRWQEKAEQGDAFSQYSLGNAYLRGNEVKIDTDKAIYWFKEAAKKNHAKSEYKLGYLYYTGKGIERNYRTAYDWFSRSASRGYSPAQFYLGKMYAEGNGIRQSKEQALEWLNKAKDNGYSPASAEIERVEEEFSSSQPRPRKVAKKPPTSKPKSTNKKRTMETMTLLLQGGWQQEDKPALILPSAQNKCSVANGTIVCKSKEQNQSNIWASINYFVESKLTDIETNGEFNLTMRQNNVFVLPSDPDDPEPDTENIPNSGWQTPTKMRCQFDDDNAVHCSTENFKQLVFSR